MGSNSNQLPSDYRQIIVGLRYAELPVRSLRFCMSFALMLFIADRDIVDYTGTTSRVVN